MVIERSAIPTVVLAVAELLAALLSLGEVTVAVLLIVPAVDGAVTTIVMGGAAEFPVIDGRVHVTVVVPEQAQPVPLAEPKVVPTGIVSVTEIDVAAGVELLVTAIV